MSTRPMAPSASRTPDREELPLAFRSWRGAGDVEAMAALANAANRADGEDQLVLASELVNFFLRDDEQFNVARDLFLVEHDGSLVAYGWTNWVDTTDGFREHRVGGYVHPDWLRRGIGNALLGRLEARGREIAGEQASDLPRIYGTSADEHRDAKRSLIVKHGYEVARSFYDMRRDLSRPIAEVALPDGIEVRPMSRERDLLRQLWRADVEAFRDHWGGFPDTEASFEMWLAEEDFDPSLHVVAWDGDEIAGASVNAIYRKDNAEFGRKHGWLESVFVRRPWRRRGLAAAVVARALHVLRDAGMERAMLGVDADNPTGAVGVYERAGFAVVKRSWGYRKPMEALE
jgi:mycothiol synthase